MVALTEVMWIEYIAKNIDGLTGAGRTLQEFVDLGALGMQPKGLLCSFKMNRNQIISGLY